jgi:hypothetical protein
MPAEFKVVPMSSLFQWPSAFAKQYEVKFAEAFAEGLNRMAGEGWEFVGTYAYHQYQSPGCAVFRRAPTPERAP